MLPVDLKFNVLTPKHLPEFKRGKSNVELSPTWLKDVCQNARVSCERRD